MDLFTIIGACLRRWPITLLLLAVVVLLSVRAYVGVEPLYMASQSIVVLPSQEADEPRPVEPGDAGATTTEPTNPYSGQGGAKFAVAVLTRNVNSSAFEQRLDLEPGVAQTFEATASNSQPMIHIEATAPSEQQASALLGDVIKEAAVVLDEFQAASGAPAPTRYRIAPAVPVGPAEDATPSRTRAAGAIGVLGTGLSVAIVVGVDALLARRHRRKLRAADDRNGESAVEDRSGETAETVSSGAPSTAAEEAREENSEHRLHSARDFATGSDEGRAAAKVMRQPRDPVRDRASSSISE